VHHRAKDICGLTAGYLTAVRYWGSDRRRSLWVVKCSGCDRRIRMAASELKKLAGRGIKASCGCVKRASIAEAQKTHGMSKHPAFAVWRSMLDRCRLPTHQAWANYGGRGITVCESWQRSFESFWSDMGGSWERGLQIERVNNGDGYSPENCRWATRGDQALNRRTNTRLETPGGRMTVAEASRRFGVKETTILYRLQNGWTDLAACTTSPTAGRISASLFAMVRGDR
jgi:hypothetical protein